MINLGTSSNPLTVAIVGSGPSAFYAAEALLQSNYSVEITMIERLPTPFGLVRNGVAPDHPKLKQPILLYEKIAGLYGFNYFGNVCVGDDIAVGQLFEFYNAIIFACGAQSDRPLQIACEILPNIHSATEFVGWYNGHPDYRDVVFDFSAEAVAIIGQGNVALDVARILAKTEDELRHTDIAEHALQLLSKSKIREIHIVGRRGPAQAKFTPQELQEFGTLADCDPYVKASDLDLRAECITEASDKMSRHIKKNLEILSRFAALDGRNKKRQCYFHFLLSPKEIVGRDRIESIRFCRNRLTGSAFNQVATETNEYLELRCGLLFRSIGYRGVAIGGVPFDEKRGVFPNRGGRLISNEGIDLYGLYAAGWIKRGPSGIIGTNRADSVATVETLLADVTMLPKVKKSGAVGLENYLKARKKARVSFLGWKKIDTHEIRAGERCGKPREKITRVAEMLGVAEGK